MPKKTIHKKPQKLTSANKRKATTLSPEHSRTKLMKAALQVFSQHGFHGATTKLISQTAKVNEALIMRHFKNKEGLFISVIEQNLIEDVEELKYPPQATLRDELVKFSDEYFDRDLKHVDFLRIVIGHAMQDRDFAKRGSNQLTSHRSKHLQDRLIRLQKLGELPQRVELETIERTIMYLNFSAMFFSVLCPMYDMTSTRKILRECLVQFANGLTSRS